MKFKAGVKRRNRRKVTLSVLAIGLVALLIVGAFIVRTSYNANLKPVSDQDTSHVVTIQSGATTAEIADVLKAKGVIRSDWAFEWYVRNHQLRDQLKAGTYVLKENQSVSDIIDVIVNGRVATDLVTILPGKRLSEIRENLIANGFTAADVDASLDPKLYVSHPALTDKPAEASLEGYLYPESFQKTATTQVSDIIKLSLDEMDLRLTPEIRQAVAKQGLTLHQAITLASIVEQEVSNGEDRPKVAQVFLRRIKEGMRLQSDATNEISQQNPAYDTYKIDGLPPGPIGNVTESSLKAVAFPAQTDWLYFVSGDDGKTYFSKTLEEHQELTKAHCTKLCGN
jgi:UPF0755 protein